MRIPFIKKKSKTGNEPEVIRLIIREELKNLSDEEDKKQKELEKERIWNALTSRQREKIEQIRKARHGKEKR